MMAVRGWLGYAVVFDKRYGTKNQADGGQVGEDGIRGEECSGTPDDIYVGIGRTKLTRLSLSCIIVSHLSAGQPV